MKLSHVLLLFLSMICGVLASKRKKPVPEDTPILKSPKKKSRSSRSTFGERFMSAIERGNLDGARTIFLKMEWEEKESCERYLSTLESGEIAALIRFSKHANWLMIAILLHAKKSSSMGFLMPYNLAIRTSSSLQVIQG